MTYITKRKPLDSFEYDYYGKKPDWWILMVRTGQAYEHSQHATFTDGTTTFNPRTGDKICLKEGRLFSLTPEQFKNEVSPLDTERDAAAMFSEKIADVIHMKIETLKALRR